MMHTPWGTIWRWGGIAWLLGGILGCATMLRPSEPVETRNVRIPRQFQDRQVIVTLAPAAPEHWARVAQALAKSYNLPQVGVFPLSSLGVQCVVYQVPADRPFEELMRRLAADPRVESVQANQAFEGLGDAHQDPYAPLQRGARAIRADLAHRWATGKGVRIGLIDTGIDTAHPDLQGRILKTANFVEGGEASFAQDSHGTAVAGVIVASADNTVGIFGIAPEAQILAVKACWHRTPGVRTAVCSSWTLAKAIDYAMLEQVQVLNMSLAGPPDALLARLLDTALRRGMTVVAAALEDGQEAPGFPASLESVIAVRVGDGTRPEAHRPAGRSTPLLAAPGTDVLTTVPGQAYDFFSGSSLAAAHVSGVVALLLEHQPQLTPRHIHTLLHAAVRPVRVASETAYAPPPLVDACAALMDLLRQPTCP